MKAERISWNTAKCNEKGAVAWKDDGVILIASARYEPLLLENTKR